MKKVTHPIHRTLGLTAILIAAALQPALAAEGGEAGGNSVLDLILHGGPLILAIWVAILATSITMVTLVIQNFMLLRNTKLAPPPMVESLRQTITSGNYQEAWEVCRANSNYVANVLRMALERIGRGKEATEDAIAEGGLREAQMVRTRNSYLSVIGVIAPMIGLLGTVIGMMNAFATLGNTGIADPRALAKSIGEVLLATASGLFIAIPAFIFYYVFRNRSQAVIVHADDNVHILMRDIPYDELQGVQIGENFNAGVPMAAQPMTAPARPAMIPGAFAQAAQAGMRKVSMSLTTNCPVCNGAITPGVNPCPHCGATLDWA